MQYNDSITTKAEIKRKNACTYGNRIRDLQMKQSILRCKFELISILYDFCQVTHFQKHDILSVKLSLTEVLRAFLSKYCF